MHTCSCTGLTLWCFWIWAATIAHVGYSVGISPYADPRVQLYWLDSLLQAAAILCRWLAIALNTPRNASKRGAVVLRLSRSLRTAFISHRSDTGMQRTVMQTWHLPSSGFDVIAGFRITCFLITRPSWSVFLWERSEPINWDMGLLIC